jgi:hypothetical protein
MPPTGLQNFLKTTVAPLFTGATVAPSSFTPKYGKGKLVACDGQLTQLRIRETTSSKELVSLDRSQPWRPDERRLIEHLVYHFHLVSNQAGPFTGRLEDFIVTRAIAKFLASGWQGETLGDVLDLYSEWSSQTYEGTRVSAGVVLERDSKESSAAVRLRSIAPHDFAKALSDGVDTWWRVDAEGRILGLESEEPKFEGDAHVGYFPLRYQTLAATTVNEAVAIALNRNGETLIFEGGSLRFARRRGRWLFFTHDPMIERLGTAGFKSKEVRRAVYESCLDAAFSRSGACIGIVRRNCREAFQASPTVPTDAWFTSENLKARCAAQVIGGRQFHSIPRLVRRQLLSLDGALVLDSLGNILTAGAILDLGDAPRGNLGGRSAAAMSLAKFGIGIKVSEDGVVSGFTTASGKPERVFQFA